MNRDPVVILHECADMVPGTRGANRLREMADAVGLRGQPLYVVRMVLEDMIGITSLYTDDERTAFALAREELVRP